MNSLYQIIKKTIVWILMVIAAAIMITLVALGYRENMSYDLFSFNYISRTPDPLKVFFLSMLFVLMMVFLRVALTSKVSILPYKKLVVSVALLQIPTIIYGVFWVYKNPYVAMFDSRRLVQLAEMVVNGGDNSAFFEYYDMMSQQRSSVFYFILITKLFPNNTYLIIRLINVFWVFLSDIVLSLIAYEVSGKKESAILASLMLALFFPLIWYSNLAYGTIPSIPVVVTSLLATIKYVEKQKIKDAVIILICLPLALIIYKGTMIAHLAVIIFLFLAFLNSSNTKYIFVALLILFEMLIVASIVNPIFIALTGMQVSKGVPTIAWIEMGLTAKYGTGGPGSYNFLINRYYEQYGNNSDAIKANVLMTLSTVVKNAVDNPADFLFFLREKTKWAWTDATFGAFKESLSQWTDYERPNFLSDFRIMVASNITERMVSFLTVYMLTTYFLSFVSCVKEIIEKTGNIKFDGKTLLRLYFVGGFTYQLIGEQKSRYCLPYFLILIVVSSIEIASIQTKNCKMRNKGLMLLNISNIFDGVCLLVSSISSIKVYLHKYLAHKSENEHHYSKDYKEHCKKRCHQII